jgi:hypothetical protein
MSHEDILIGDFLPFTEEVEIAVLSGMAVERCVDLIGNRPPFREVDEAARLSESHIGQMRNIACTKSIALSLSRKVNRIDRSVKTVIISSSGALALRPLGTHINIEVFSAIKEFDGGNRLLIYDFRPNHTYNS